MTHNQLQIIITLTVILVWLASTVVCILKGRWVSAIAGFILWPYAMIVAIRLAHPESYYANWFYRRNLHKYWRAVERFGLIPEHSAMIPGNTEVSREFHSFLRRKATSKQRLSGLKSNVMFLIDLPCRFLFALISFTFLGWIGWLGMLLVLLKVIGVIHWPWWVAALPLEYGVIYSVYMTIDGELYRAGLKDVGRYARFTQSEHEYAKLKQADDTASMMSELGRMKKTPEEKERMMDSLKITRLEIGNRVYDNLPERLRNSERVIRAIAEQINYATASRQFVGDDEEMRRKLEAVVAEFRLNGADQAANELISAVKTRPHYLALAEGITV